MHDITLNYDAVARSSVTHDPCPHLVVKDFITCEEMKRVVRFLPEISSGGSYPPESLSLAPALARMIDDFQGKRLKDIVSEKFGLDVCQAPSMLTLRGRTRNKDGRIHRDSVSKLVTILLYLNPPDQNWTDGRSAGQGCLRFTNGPDDIEDYACEVPPIGGTLVIFPNGPATWHGHRQYIGPRYTIQLNYMAASSKARRELARHKLSSLWKRLSLAA